MHALEPFLGEGQKISSVMTKKLVYTGLVFLKYILCDNLSKKEHLTHK